VAAAFNHFHTMIAHPVRGHPMGHAFDEQTRDAAQVMMSLRTPEPVGDLVERVAKAICCEGYPCSAERDGNICVAIENWANEARAAIAAMPYREAEYEDGYTAGELKWADAMDKQIGIEESLRTQLAASHADVSRLREAMKQIIALRVGSFSHSAPLATAMKRLARAAIKDTQP
jgi:hypothetical protein